MGEWEEESVQRSAFRGWEGDGGEIFRSLWSLRIAVGGG